MKNTISSLVFLLDFYFWFNFTGSTFSAADSVSFRSVEFCSHDSVTVSASAQPQLSVSVGSATAQLLFFRL